MAASEPSRLVRPARSESAPQPLGTDVAYKIEVARRGPPETPICVNFRRDRLAGGELGHLDEEVASPELELTHKRSHIVQCRAHHEWGAAATPPNLILLRLRASFDERQILPGREAPRASARATNWPPRIHYDAACIVRARHAPRPRGDNTRALNTFMRGLGHERNVFASVASVSIASSRHFW